MTWWANLFHWHTWTEKARFFREGITVRSGELSMPAHDFFLLIQPMTTILYECTICHEVKKLEISGACK